MIRELVFQTQILKVISFTFQVAFSLYYNLDQLIYLQLWLTDAEIVPSETQKGRASDVSGRLEIVKIGEFSDEPINRETGLDTLDTIVNANHNDIKSRIQLLESELSSVLHSLRSNTSEVTMLMVSRKSNNIMN